MLCEFYDYSNDLISFHAILEKFSLVPKTRDAAAALGQRDVSRLAPCVTIAKKFYFCCCKVLPVDLSLYINYLLIHTRR